MCFVPHKVIRWSRLTFRRWAGRQEGQCKFRLSPANEINVLGLTLLGEIDGEVQESACEWIKTRNDIDAILLFSRFSARRSGFDPQVLRKGELLDEVMMRELSLSICASMGSFPRRSDFLSANCNSYLKNLPIAQIAQNQSSKLRVIPLRSGSERVTRTGISL